MNIRVTPPEDMATPEETLYRAPAMPGIETPDDLYQIEDDGHTLDGADPQADNVRRASFAAAAVIAYAEATGVADDPIEQVMSDLMGDMQHLLDVLRESGDMEDGDFPSLEGLLDSGSVHYEAEIRGEL